MNRAVLAQILGCETSAWTTWLAAISPASGVEKPGCSVALSPGVSHDTRGGCRTKGFRLAGLRDFWDGAQLHRESS
jgi:hypothetical protein